MFKKIKKLEAKVALLAEELSALYEHLGLAYRPETTKPAEVVKMTIHEPVVGGFGWYEFDDNSTTVGTQIVEGKPKKKKGYKRTCEDCGRVCKNTHGLAIHRAMRHNKKV